NDWFEFEQIPGVIKNGDRCGESSDHYNLYESDFKLLRSLNQNALRTGIEWSRIVPEENVVPKQLLDKFELVTPHKSKIQQTE
ncbi:MAG: family 1 glycosylhydrolase, partial [Candidatus Heimdallarchaeaceae archaeon]